MTELISKNVKLSRYEMGIGGHIVYADYVVNKDVITIKYVYAPPELRGTGAAGRFMDALMGELRAEKLKVVPQCGYAAAWIQRHPTYQSLLA